MTNLISVTRRTAIAAAALCALAGSRVATAQATQATAAVDSRWDAFLGCWRAGEAGGVIQSPSLVCVAPTAVVSAVQITTVRNDSVIARDTIDASGTHRNFSKQGCSGWESAEWSADARRVYLRSDLTCGNGLERTGTGLFAIAPSGEWLDVQGMSAGGNEGLRVNHYRETQPSAATLAAIGGNAVSGRELSISSERTAAGAQITVGDIGEVVLKTDTAVTQAWIVERHARFNLTAKELVAMSKAGIPGSVTDVMVGLSYPEHFALQEPGMDQMVASNGISPRDSARIASEYLNDRCSSVDSRWDYPGSFDPCLYSARSRYGYGYGYGYPYGFDYGYGYSPYGGYGAGYYGGYYGGGYSVPVVIVKGDQATEPHGRVVNGRGYTQGTTSGGSTGTGTSSTSYGTGSTSTAPAPAPAPSAPSSSGSSSSGSSGGRTAIPRPPR